MKKYLPFIITDFRSIRRMIWLFEMVFWPLMALASFGIFLKFVGANDYLKALMFTGVIGWSTINLTQTAISRAFMHELWDRTLKHTFSAPITFYDFIIGHWLFGIFEIIIAFGLMSIIALNFFNFNIFSIGIYIPLALGLIALCGLLIGIIAISIILTFGLRMDFIVWSIVDMVVFVSGIYYSVTVFPESIQTISHLFPVVYVFEGMRTVLTGLPAFQIFTKGYLIALIWTIIAFMLFKKIEINARKNGFYQKYG